MARIFLISGNDPSLLLQEVRAAVSACLDGGNPDHTLIRLEAEDYQEGDDYKLSALVTAAATPPMLEPHRVIEARHLGLFGNKKDLEDLYEYLENPMETTDLVMVWEKAAHQQRLPNLPKKLKDAVIAAGGKVISASRPSGARNVREWFQTQIQISGLPLDQSAVNLMQDRLGEDYGRLKSVLDSLAGAYGAEAEKALSAEDVRPYIGEGGSVPVWELTSALSKGDGIESISCLKRRLSAGEHPLAIMAFLTNHYMRQMRLDKGGGSGTSGLSPAAAAKELGISEYPAKLAIEESKKLGTKKLAKIFELLNKADKDLKGQSALEGDLIMEILIARIAQQYRLPVR